MGRWAELLVTPTAQERRARLPGDELVAPADVVMDRAFTLDARPAQVWPWLVQLGKRRAGWYLPRRAELAVPVRRRGLRRVEQRWQQLTVGDVVPDWGGRDATFTVAEIVADSHLVYTSTRGRTRVSWCLAVVPDGLSRTRVQLRLRLAPVRHRRLAERAGGALDLLTVAGLAAGLRERIGSRSPAR